MKRTTRFLALALLLTGLRLPAAQAQVGVNVTIGSPAWGPPAPAGSQYYYIPEIDGYYDLYSQQYLVFQDGYWVPLPQLYGYDPYQFHPVVMGYCGPQPWQYRRDYYHRQYAYAPYRPYGGGPGYYAGGYHRPYHYRGGESHGSYGGGYGPPRGATPQYQPQPDRGSTHPYGGGPQGGGGRGDNGGGHGRR